MPVVNPNPGQFRVMDFGQAARTGAAIEGAQLRNKALGMEITEQEDMLRNRKKAQEIRMQFERTPDQIEALEDAGMYDEADKLRNGWMDMAIKEINMIKGMRDGINEKNYESVREALINKGSITGEMWPMEYSDDWFREVEEQKKGNFQRWTTRWAENGVIMAQDYVAQEGVVDWSLTGDPYQDPAAKKKTGDGTGDGSKFKYTASDSNAIRRGAAEMFGGFYDPVTGGFKGLDRDTAERVTGLSSLAQKLYMRAGRAGQQIPHDTALAQAARVMRIRVPNLDEQANIDNLLGFGERDRTATETPADSSLGVAGPQQ